MTRLARRVHLRTLMATKAKTAVKKTINKVKRVVRDLPKIARDVVSKPKRTTKRKRSRRKSK